MNIHENEEVAELPIPIKSEVEYAIKQLKNGKSPGIDNISSELIKEGCTVLTELCMDYKVWPSIWTTSLIIPLPTKSNLKNCQNYR